MQLTFFIVRKENMLKSAFVFLCLSIIGGGNVVVAESLTYSPDQWPRHWNVLMNKSYPKDRLNSHRRNGKVLNQAPTRSPFWGVVPASKQKPRRSVRPEYNTNGHIQNYYGQNFNQGNYYSGFSSFGLANPYNSALLVPGLMPGFIGAGIPFGSHPYVTPFPYMGGYPVMGGIPGSGYRW